MKSVLRLAPIIFTTTLLSSCIDSNVRDESTPALAPVKESEGNKNAVDDTLRGVCSIKPERTVKLKAQTGGEIRSVFVEQGTQVKKGQILATIDVETLVLKRQRLVLENEKLSQRSDLLKFQIARAEKEMSAMQILYSTTGAAISKEAATVFERKANLKDSELDQKLNQLDTKTVDDQIRKAEVRAPFDGIILTRSAEPGMVVASASEAIGGAEVLFEIADPSRLQALCVAKEADALSLRNNAEVQITAEDDGIKPVVGKIVRLSPVISSDGGISRREFYVSLPQRESKSFLPGMNAIAKLNR